MTDENRYGEYDCKAPECSAVFMSREKRDHHYRRVHVDEADTDDREHAPPLRRQELLNPEEADGN